MVLGSVIPTYAAEASEDNLQVDLEIIKISTEYNKEDYEVVYDFGAESNNAYIYEKSTNRIVEEYEEIIQEVSGKARVAAGYRNVDVYTYFYPSSANHSSTKMRALASIYVYTETISSQTVNSIISINSLTTELVGSGPYTFETCSTTESRHTLSYVDVNCTGVLQAVSQEALSKGFSISLLEEIGFSVEESSTFSWIARLPYSKVIRITV